MREGGAAFICLCSLLRLSLHVVLLWPCICSACRRTIDLDFSRDSSRYPLVRNDVYASPCVLRLCDGMASLHAVAHLETVRESHPLYRRFRRSRMVSLVDEQSATLGLDEPRLAAAGRGRQVRRTAVGGEGRSDVLGSAGRLGRRRRRRSP